LIGTGRDPGMDLILIDQPLAGEVELLVMRNVPAPNF
jgi:hypothetical protein